MPTAAKLVAALCLAVLAFVTSELIKPLMPASTQFGLFSYVNTAIGLITGWLVVGNRAGRGQVAAVSNGLTGVVALVFWCLFVHSTNEMVDLAMRHRYDGPVEAAVGIFELIVKYGTVMIDVRVIGTLLFGALLTGFLSEVVAGRWR